MSGKQIFSAFILTIGGLLSFSSLAYADLGPISLRFCNNPDELTKQLNLSLGTDQPGSICMQFMNDSDKAKFIDVGFVDGITTNDQEQNKACKNNGENELFGQYVSSNIQNPIRIPAGGSIKVIGSIKYPSNMPGGEMLGCVVFSDVESNTDTTQQGNAFAIKVRKASFVNISLSGEILLGLSFVDISKQASLFASLTNSPFIRGYESRQRRDLLQANVGVQINQKRESGVILEYSLYNSGSVSQQVSIQTTITDFLGNTLSLPISQRTINASQTTLFRESVSQLPRYKGGFKVKVSVSHKPIVSATSTDTQGKFKQATITQETSFFIIPRLPIVLVLLVLSLIILLITIYQKSNHQKKTVQSYAKLKSYTVDKRISSQQQEKKVIHKILNKPSKQQQKSDKQSVQKKKTIGFTSSSISKTSAKTSKPSKKGQLKKTDPIPANKKTTAKTTKTTISHKPVKITASKKTTTTSKTVKKKTTKTKASKKK